VAGCGNKSRSDGAPRNKLLKKKKKKERQGRLGGGFGSQCGPALSHPLQNPNVESVSILFYFIFFNQQFITRCLIAVRGRAIQTVRTLRLRYALPVTTYQVLKASFWRATTDIRPAASSKTMSPFRAVNAGVSHQAAEIAMSIPGLPSERSPDQNPPQRAGQSLEGIKPL
jgi:hypothetical protein